MCLIVKALSSREMTQVDLIYEFSNMPKSCEFCIYENVFVLMPSCVKTLQIVHFKFWCGGGL